MKINKLKSIRKKFKKVFILLISTFFLVLTKIIIKEAKNNSLIICMCCIVKLENLYIDDFISYYKNLGYNHFFIYDNNDVDGEKLKESLYDNNFISIINYRGFRGKRGGPQMSAYYNCYDNNKNKCNWISFFDIDEFLILEPNMTIQEFLDDSRYSDCQSIKLNWRIFSDNNYLEYENKPYMDRFKERKKNHVLNTMTKIITKGNLSDKIIKKSYNPHSIWSNANVCNSQGKKESSNFPKNAYLNHYYSKTIREYCHKLKKGNVYYNITINKKVLTRQFKVFFSINNKTKEKVKIFNEEFNTSFDLKSLL